MSRGKRVKLQFVIIHPICIIAWSNMLADINLIRQSQSRIKQVVSKLLESQRNLSIRGNKTRRLVMKWLRGHFPVPSKFQQSVCTSNMAKYRIQTQARHSLLPKISSSSNGIIICSSLISLWPFGQYIGALVSSATWPTWLSGKTKNKQKN